MGIYRIIQFVFLFQVFTLSLPGSLYSQVVINEIMASNATSYADPQTGSYYDWIELYNNSPNTIDLGGYYLSDDPKNPFSWPFPSGTLIAAHQYLIVYCDGSGQNLHTSFKLSKEGEQIVLANTQRGILDSVNFPYQMADISYGRKPDEPYVLGYFEVPTPGALNNDQMALGISPSPVFSLKGGFYAGNQTVEIIVKSPDAQIFYTLDGTEPTINSLPYDNPIVLTMTSVLRVRSFKNGYLPSQILTQTYLIDEPVNLPVVSLGTDPNHFFSDETGIYVQGTAGITGYCSDVPLNVNQDWERPVNIEFFEKDGSPKLNQVAGVKIFGGCTRVRYPIKSLAFYARKQYESSSFDYQLFPDKPASEYETFILRASGDDQPFTMFKDALTQMVVKDVIDVDVQAYRPVVLYINGEYWGIHNMREKINEHYARNNFGVNSDSVDMLKGKAEFAHDIVHGSPSHYRDLIAYLENNDISLPSHYNYICSQMDKDEYINYQITQIFFGARDWPGNNIKYWRSSEKPYDRWRWILYDLDHTFTHSFTDIMDEATEVDCACEWPNPPWSTYLFRRMLENQSFRDEFIERFFLYSESHFSRERIHGIIDQLRGGIAPEIPRHILRWGGQRSNFPDLTGVSPIFSSVEQWEGNVQRMRDFTDTRHEMAKKQVMDYFGLSDLTGFTASVEPASQGSIVVGNAVITNTSVSADIPSGQQLEVSCIPEPGFVLSHWEVTSGQEKDSILIPRGDAWKYLESVGTPATDWMSLNFNDENWQEGTAEFGYGDDDEATVIGYGDDSQQKMITAWFRKKFVIADKTAFTRYTLHLQRDDGARVYLNGIEVIRDNMDGWALESYSPASQDVNGQDETYFHTFQINPALFLEGENILAVEIHQASASSDDLSFNLELLGTYFIPGNYDFTTSSESKLSLTMNSPMAIIAFIIPEASVVENVFINEVMAKNSLGYVDERGDYEDWIELYNGNNEPVDLAGLYLSDAWPAWNVWQISTGNPELTTILPFGHKVFVADGEPSEGLLHMDFKLDKEGDQVLLLQVLGNDTIVIDHLQFGAQIENVSWGRYPDGTDSLRFMSVSTPMAANYWEPEEVTSPPGQKDPVHIFPNPTSGPLFVQFNHDFPPEIVSVQIRIYSSFGRLISAMQYSVYESIEISLSNQPQGLYFVRIVAGSKTFEKKIVVD